MDKQQKNGIQLKKFFLLYFMTFFSVMNVKNVFFSLDSKTSFICASDENMKYDFNFKTTMMIITISVREREREH